MLVSRSFSSEQHKPQLRQKLSLLITLVKGRVYLVYFRWADCEYTVFDCCRQ